MKEIKPFLLTAVGLLTFGAFATGGTFTIKNEMNGKLVDFTDGDCFVGGSAPGEGDVVVFEGNCRSILVDDTTIGGLDKISELKMTYGRQVTIEIANDQELSCAIAGDGTYESTILKKGAGKLTLKSFKLVRSGFNQDYYARINVKGGSIVLPSSGSVSGILYMTELSIDEGCSISVGNLAEVRLIRSEGLNGAGTFTFNGTTGTSGSKLSLGGANFSGKLLGSFNLYPYGGAKINLKGAENGFSGAVYMNTANACYGVQSFGNGGDSSIGSAAAAGTVPIYIRENGGGFKYLGSGETANRSFAFSFLSGKAEIDGGDNGDLVFGSGSTWMASSTSTVYDQPLTISGSNAEHPCVMRGAITSSSGQNQMHIQKDGEGTWAMEGDKSYGGAWCVRNGTLQFNSLEDSGLQSALGTSAQCRERANAVAPAAVDYAFLLGDEGTTGVLEYTGSNLVFCTGRPIALAGNGGLKNDSPVSFRFDGVSARTAGDKTFTLGGASTNENEIAGISDAVDRKISIVKNGSGTWTLNGSNTIHGAIAVNGGKLIVRKDARKYTWFKFMMDENYNANAEPVYLSEIGLYSDKTSGGYTVQVNKNLKVVTNGVSRINPGEAVFPRHYRQNAVVDASAKSELWRLFDGTYHNALKIASLNESSNAMGISPSNPMGQVPVIMRLPANVDEVHSYDIQTTFGKGSADKKRMLRAFSMYGSVDGVHWDLLSSKRYATDDDLPNTYCWYSGPVDGNSDAGHHGDIPIAGSRATDPAFTVLDNVSEVSVATGAVFAVQGAETKPVISRLVVSADGAGTLDGFAFAETGTIVLKDDPGTNQQLRVTWNFAETEGVANLSNWSLELEAGAKKRSLMSVDETGATFIRDGLILMVR